MHHPLERCGYTSIGITVPLNDQGLIIIQVKLNTVLMLNTVTEAYLNNMLYVFKIFFGLK